MSAYVQYLQPAFWLKEQIQESQTTTIQTIVRQNAPDVESVEPSLPQGSLFALLRDIYLMFAALVLCTVTLSSDLEAYTPSGWA